MVEVSNDTKVQVNPSAKRPKTNRTHHLFFFRQIVISRVGRGRGNGHTLTDRHTHFWFEEWEEEVWLFGGFGRGFREEEGVVVVGWLGGLCGLFSRLEFEFCRRENYFQTTIRFFSLFGVH